jgi:hypothetical protein
VNPPPQLFVDMPKRAENLLVFAAVLEPISPELEKRPTSGRTLPRVSELAAEDKRMARLPLRLRRIMNRIMKAAVPCLVLGSSLVSTAVLLVLILVS